MHRSGKIETNYSVRRDAFPTRVAREDAISHAFILGSGRLESANRCINGERRLCGSQFGVYIALGREAAEDQVSPTICNAHGGPYRLISTPLIHHREYICCYASRPVEWNAPAPLQDKMQFVGPGPRRTPKGRPYAGHREANRPLSFSMPRIPKLTCARQFQRGMVVATNRQMASTSTGNRRMGAKKLAALLFSCARA